MEATTPSDKKAKGKDGKPSPKGDPPPEKGKQNFQRKKPRNPLPSRVINLTERTGAQEVIRWENQKP